MTDSFILTDGTNSYELVYDPVSQTDYKLLYGVQVQIEKPDVLMHTPDFAESIPVQAVDRDRTVFLSLHQIDGADWDGKLDSLAPLKRLVDGAHSQALRYWTHNDVNRVVLRIQLDGMTNYTDLPIKYGYVDDGGSYYQPVSILNKVNYNVGVVLAVGPYGEGAAISLRNDLASSPHFIEDSDGDGLADGWTLTGTPAKAIETAKYLVGGKCQAFQAPATATDSGINIFKSISGGDQIVAYAWINFGSGSDNVSVILQESGATTNIIQQKTLSRSNPTATADKTAIDGGGFTWYRVVVSGTANASANGVQLRIRRKSTDGSTLSVFNVDACYLQTGTLTAPDAWCSTSSIKTRYDTDVSIANINYMDFWGIPGDVPALIDLRFAMNAGANSISSFIVGKQTVGSYLPGRHWVSQQDTGSLDSDGLIYYANGSTYPDGTESTPTDANRFSGEYIRLTADASPVGDYLLVPFTDQATEAERIKEVHRFLSCPRRVFAVARSSSLSTSFQLSEDLNNYIGDHYSVIGEAQNPNKANTWELYDLGYITPSRNIDITSAYFAGSGVDPYLLIKVTPGAAGATVDVDAVLFVPAGDNSFVVASVPAPGATPSSPNSIFGDYSYLFSDGRVYMDSDYYSNTGSALGNIGTIQSGHRQTRLVFVLFNIQYTSGVLDHITMHTDSAAVVVPTITPRSRHLLGTA